MGGSLHPRRRAGCPEVGRAGRGHLLEGRGRLRGGVVVGQRLLHSTGFGCVSRGQVGQALPQTRVDSEGRPGARPHARGPPPALRLPAERGGAGEAQAADPLRDAARLGASPGQLRLPQAARDPAAAPSGGGRAAARLGHARRLRCRKIRGGLQRRGRPANGGGHRAPRRRGEATRRGLQGVGLPGVPPRLRVLLHGPPHPARALAQLPPGGEADRRHEAPEAAGVSRGERDPGGGREDLFQVAQLGPRACASWRDATRGGRLARAVLGLPAHPRDVRRAFADQPVLVQRRPRRPGQVLHGGGAVGAVHDAAAPRVCACEPGEPRVPQHELALRVSGGGEAEIQRRNLRLVLPRLPRFASGDSGQ
mmetsp:Transcript_12713/g.36533  ORF Transcript_12713/g.36533 Transcript_12713/m.36533 type:complete len:365 (-) Transcript_12713:618-1712(-)